VDRPAESTTLHPLRLCLIGASLALAFVAAGFIAGGSAASASESNGEGAGPLSSPASLVNEPVPLPAPKHDIAAVIAQPVVPVVDKVAVAVVAPIAPPAEAVADEAVSTIGVGSAVVDAIVAHVDAPVTESVQVLVTSDVEELAGTPRLFPADPVENTDAPGATALHSGRSALSGGPPDSAELVPAPLVSSLSSNPGDSPTFPIAPASPAGNGGNGGGSGGAGPGGGPYASDVAGATAPLVLPGGRQDRFDDDSVPASPACEHGSTPD
jgi:hypothetical protein